MASFNLDFHRRRFQQPMLGWTLAIAGLIGAAATAFFTLAVEERATQTDTLKSQLAISERTLMERSVVMETPEQRELRERLGAWSSNALTPLRVVEASWSGKLAMSQLTLARDEGLMVVEFEASSLKEGMDLHRRLIKNGYFKDVKLLRHSVSSTNGIPVVLMAIELQWGASK